MTACLTSTIHIDTDFFTVFQWYDNELAFVGRRCDIKLYWYRIARKGFTGKNLLHTVPDCGVYVSVEGVSNEMHE